MVPGFGFSPLRFPISVASSCPYIERLESSHSIVKDSIPRMSHRWTSSLFGTSRTPPFVLTTLFYKNVGRPIYLFWISHTQSMLGRVYIEIGSRDRAVAVSPIVQLYVCAIDGLSYEDRDGVMAHMKLQHGIERFESSLVRERRFT